VARVGRERSWADELLDLVSAASGGLLFGVPLLYTLEVWDIGARSTPTATLLVLLATALPLFALAKTAGFRATAAVHARDAAADTVEGIAVGLVVTAIVLLLLREVRVGDPAASSLGKVVYESVPFCLGIGLARQFLHGSRVTGESDDADGSDQRGSTADDRDDDLPVPLADLGASVVGATLVALSIAPTDEVAVIASALTPAWLLALVVASLVASYAIVFAAGFRRQEARYSARGAFQRPITETMVSYLLGVIVALVLLWLFQRGGTPPSEGLAHAIVLGLPAAVGGAAGRLVV
jgi:putative integral membrane protein (TIGR02587 family)